MGFDITRAAVADSSFLHLKDAEDNLLWFVPEGAADPEKEKQAVGVELYGPGSREHAQASAKRQGRNMMRIRKKGLKAEMSADEITEEGATYLAAITKGFRNLDYDNVPVATPDQFKAVYSDRRIGFVADQVQEHIGGWENFTKSSATS